MPHLYVRRMGASILCCLACVLLAACSSSGSQKVNLLADGDRSDSDSPDAVDESDLIADAEESGDDDTTSDLPFFEDSSDGDIDDPDLAELDDGEEMIDEFSSIEDDDPEDGADDPDVESGETDPDDADNVEYDDASFDDLDTDQRERDMDDPMTDYEKDADESDTVSAQDEYLVRAMIAGERTPEDVFLTVANNGGWPVKTAQGTYLFAHWHTPSDSWFLTGDHNDWGLSLMQAGSGFAWIEVSIASPEGVRYKFTRSNSWIADPFARSYEYNAEGQFSYVRPPSSEHCLERWPGFRSDEFPDLAARDLRVYRPSGKGPWPLLLMQDGQNLFDPSAAYGGWKLHQAVLAVGKAVLIVGIDNTSDRLAEYAHVDDETAETGLIVAEGSNYAALVMEHIKPFIEARYNVKTGVSRRVGLMGSSMGGLVSLHIAHRYPDKVDFVGSLSGSLGWGRYTLANALMEERYLNAPLRSFVIYVDSGGGDGGDGCTDPNEDGFPVDDPNQSDEYCATRHFADAMADHGYTWESNLHHFYAPNAAHNEAAWAARVNKPLSIFLSL